MTDTITQAVATTGWAYCSRDTPKEKESIVSVMIMVIAMLRVKKKSQKKSR